MSNIKISEWIEAESVSEDDYVPIIQNGINKKVKASQIGTGGGGDTLPIGAVVELASNTVPNNWLLCNGQAVSRTEYAGLFRAIGTTWGAGDGSTTFNVPNRAGLIAIGAGTHIDTNGTSKTFVLGQEYGEYNHTLTTQEMPSHNHTVPIDSFVNNDSQTNQLRGGHIAENVGAGINYPTNSAGGSQSHNNIQPSIATNFIIKARQSAGVSASVIQEDGTPNETDVYSSEAVEAKLTYSTTEQKVGTWIDGNPIYRKVFDINNPLFSGDTYNFNHDISNIDWLVDARAISVRSGSGSKNFQKFSRLGTTQQFEDIQRYALDLGDIKASGQVQFIKGSLQSLARIVLILEYTKTTD